MTTETDNAIDDSQPKEHPMARAIRMIKAIPADVLDEMNEQITQQRKWYEGKRAHEFIEFLRDYCFEGEETLNCLRRAGHSEFLYRATFDRLLADGVIEECTIQRGKRNYPGLRLVYDDESEAKWAKYQHEAEQAEVDYEKWEAEVNNKRFGLIETVEGR